MKVNVIPIVMGMVDYANILPKDSYIDTRDFTGPQHLASYIKYVVRHKNVYNQYLRNKNSLDCINTLDYLPKPCRLCKRLHELRGKKRVVHDLARKFSKRKCADPKKYFDPAMLQDNAYT